MGNGINMPLGINNLSQFMKKISANANLDIIYTNHCVCPTMVTQLHDSGVTIEEIARVPGHKLISNYLITKILSNAK